MLNNINISQKKLLLVLLPVITIIILFLLSNEDDIRTKYFSILIASIITIYTIFMILGKENEIAHWGLKYLIVFPVSVVLIGVLIAKNPYIFEYSGHWSPKKPFEQVFNVNKLYLDHQLSTGGMCHNEKHVKKYPACTNNVLAKNKQYLAQLENTYQDKIEQNKLRLLEWEKERRYITPRKTILFRDELIDYRIAWYWIMVVIMIGIIMFRILSTNKHNNNSE